MVNEPRANSLWHLIDDPHLKWLTSEEVIAQGRGLSESGCVTTEDVGSVWISAVVSDGSATYNVELNVLYDGDLEYKCQCPESRQELFCMHCTATAFFWREGDYDPEYPALNFAGGEKNGASQQSFSQQSFSLHSLDTQNSTLLSDFRTTLESLEKSALIELLVDCAARDSSLPRRLASGEFQRRDTAEAADELDMKEDIDYAFDDFFFIPDDLDEINVLPDDLYAQLYRIFKDNKSTDIAASAKLAAYCLERLDESIDLASDCFRKHDFEVFQELADFLVEICRSGLMVLPENSHRQKENFNMRKKFPTIFGTLDKGKRRYKSKSKVKH